MSWKPGPLPPDAFGWGGVVPTDHEGEGFYFADFHGDFVLVMDAGANEPKRMLRPHEVRWYDNSLSLPPDSKCDDGGP